MKDDKIKIIDYDSKRMDNFEYTGTDKRFKLDPKKLVDAYSKFGAAYMVLINDRVEAIGGISRAYVGIGFAWMFFNPGASRFIKTIYKRMRAEIKKAFDSGCWRIQTDCSIIDKNIRLLEHLGFKREALMRKAGIDGGDMYLYAKIKEE